MFGWADGSQSAWVSFNKNPDQADMAKSRVKPEFTTTKERKLRAVTGYSSAVDVTLWQL